MMDFSGKLVYITGGSSGIGLACARELAAKGADVALLARNMETLGKTAEDVKAHRRDPRQNVFILSVDVADPLDVEEKMARAVTEFGAPDILINSAGINKYSNFCIPGRTTPFLYFFHRLTNGRITRLVSDMVVRIARRK